VLKKGAATSLLSGEGKVFESLGARIVEQLKFLFPRVRKEARGPAFQSNLVKIELISGHGSTQDVFGESPG